MAQVLLWGGVLAIGLQFTFMVLELLKPFVFEV